MQWLIDRFQTAPDRVAFIHEGREVSYGGVIAFTEIFHQRVQNAGIRTGDTVAVLGDYSPEVFCMIMALGRNGSIVIPLTRTSVVEESVALGVSGCSWYIEFDATGQDSTITHRGLKSDNALLNEFLKRNAPGLVLFSSGSTGTPKAILHDLNQVTEKFRKQRAPSVAIPFLMLDHFGGINTLLAITSSLGKVVTVKDRSVARICEAIEKYKVELLPATPSFLNLMMASHIHKKYDLSSLTRITYGTEVMSQATLNRLRTHFPNADLLQTYGLSEVGVLRSQSREDGSLWVRVGGEGFQTKVVDGVLWVKSQYAMLGYLNAPSQFDAEGWFNTQDLVETDGDFFRILGRATDMINVAGHKVYPSEIEEVILGLENIQDVAVFGEKNNLLGYIVVAKVVLQEPEPLDFLKKRIRNACLAQLSAYKAPAKILVTENELHNERQKKVRREHV